MPLLLIVLLLFLLFGGGVFAANGLWLIAIVLLVLAVGGFGWGSRRCPPLPQPGLCKPRATWSQLLAERTC